MRMNKNVLSFTWSVLRLSSLCGLALTLTGMTHATKAKACYQCVSVGQGGSYHMCQSESVGGATCVGGGVECSISGSCN
jgi:hypothetical protein